VYRPRGMGVGVEDGYGARGERDRDRDRYPGLDDLASRTRTACRENLTLQRPTPVAA